MRFDTRLKLGRATLAAALLASGLMAVTAANAGEAPELAALVAAGTLPALEERLPANPLVVPVVEQIGVYSDVWHSAMVGGADEPWVYRTVSYENLMRWTPDWSGVIPNIAESVDVNDDATEYTFHLREGMKWSDGAPFTSADIQFWYEDLFANEQFTPAPAEPFINVDGSPVAFEVIDETTFKFTFANPKGLFLQYLATARPLDNASVRYPRHYLEKFHPKYNPDVAAEITAAGATDWIGLMVNKSNFMANTEVPTVNALGVHGGYGSGDASRAVAERNPYYWKVDPEGNQLPYINTRAFDVLSDPQVLVTKTLAGEIDLQDRNLATTANKPVLFEGQEAGGFEFFEETPASPNYMVMMFNLNHKDPNTRALFQNKDFRIGLSHAMDRQEVLDVVWLGQGEVAQTSPMPGSVYYNERLAKQYTEHDLATANEHLDKVLPNKDANGLRLAGRLAVRLDLCLQRRDPGLRRRARAHRRAMGEGRHQDGADPARPHADPDPAGRGRTRGRGLGARRRRRPGGRARPALVVPVQPRQLLLGAGLDRLLPRRQPGDLQVKPEEPAGAPKRRWSSTASCRPQADPESRSSS